MRESKFVVLGAGGGGEDESCVEISGRCLQQFLQTHCGRLLPTHHSITSRAIYVAAYEPFSPPVINRRASYQSIYDSISNESLILPLKQPIKISFRRDLTYLYLSTPSRATRDFVAISGIPNLDSGGIPLPLG
ncbi:hypothetical protein CEXT_603911 [Caerostris extrusa]|uniref:Uncharacterized protein n=1 Tax=Caerostris extrusa TaxID=172846 RepID=A0AAV4SUI8_CAEEX|nr:hypothetical protein CEXT_603911 [Caerostris extrusa]